MTQQSNLESANPPTSLAARVRFQSTGKLYDFDARPCPDVRPGDFVLVETTRGQQLGEVVSLRPLRPQDEKNLKPIQRRASGHDLVLRQHRSEQEAQALAIAREIAARLKLGVKIALAEYTFDGQRLTILYVSDDKKLTLDKFQRQLQERLGVTVDVRRIGSRDYAKLLGGYGACGDRRCCATFLADFCPVSINMAKAQGMSLNPEDITGMCGRLRCCLVYEDEQYTEASRSMPRRKKRVRTPHGEGKVVDLLPLKGIVVVQIEERRVEVPLEQVELIQDSESRPPAARPKQAKGTRS